nr:hypothetical protein [Ktedonobacterales bacterium]
MSSVVYLAPRRGGARIVALSLILATALALVGASTLFVGTAHAFTNGFVAAPANTSILMQKYNTARTGWNANETHLTTASVNSTNFGRLTSYPVDGQVYAQPLFVPNVVTPAGPYNLVFVATEHDSVYAFDADHQSATPIWHTSFAGPNISSVPYQQIYSGGFHDIQPEIGITGTPVIDAATGTLYVVALTVDNGTIVSHLHALSIATGQEKIAPMLITASVAGTGDGNVNGTITFNPKTQNQRMGLLLLNNIIYIGFASFADEYPYHGWVLTYDAQTLQPKATLNITPDSSGAGIWDDGNSFVVDPQDGGIYVATGNSGEGPHSDNGNTVLKLNPVTLEVEDYFTPFNTECLNDLDRDLGSGGVILLPTQNGPHPYELLAGGKEGRIYLLDRTNLGKFTAVSDPCGPVESQTNIDKVVQELPVGVVGSGIYSTPAFWQGPTSSYVYEASNGDFLKAFRLTDGQLSTTPTSQTPETFNYPGGNAVVSSNGSTANTGIVWIISPPGSCPVNDHCNPSGSGALRAYDATDLSNELYSSTQIADRDGLASFVKFSVPAIANGEVFVGTGNSLDIFGL